MRMYPTASSEVAELLKHGSKFERLCFSTSNSLAIGQRLQTPMCEYLGC